MHPIGLNSTQKDLDLFLKTKGATSLRTKAESVNQAIDLEIRENFIADKKKETHSYEASYAAAFIRSLLYLQNVYPAIFLSDRA